MEIPIDLCQRMESLVHKTVQEYGLANIKDPEIVATRLGIRSGRGYLQKVNGFFHHDSNVIVINDNIDYAQRKRFTFFHEICHSLLRKDDDFLSVLNDLYEDDEQFREAEERLCDVGASEFIAPKGMVGQLIRDKGFSINLLFELERLFGTSKQMAMWRLAECAAHPCILAICKPEYHLFPVIKIGVNEIKVINSWNSDSTRYKLRKTTPIPIGHPIWDTYSSNNEVFTFPNSFIQYYTGKQMGAAVEVIWINGWAYTVFNLHQK
ncbi:hypothetical protein DRW41_03715 [Neobacillus piezotolerans]|uniref:IrrE N-terminal-like domain-containing protein n=1 Tax=Neobacillus piezotolerans TaxID=2259171 RepID=A0A3D8GW39_9BACI|nr:ImmA/IrrE family metallo-endopeptidase [Neobacillus piezotolerans]RDU38678.1 hypothetical protein DRW41_03715 [Neobacillus piezotolerans]